MILCAESQTTITSVLAQDALLSNSKISYLQQEETRYGTLGDTLTESKIYLKVNAHSSFRHLGVEITTSPLLCKEHVAMYVIKSAGSICNPP